MSLLLFSMPLNAQNSKPFVIPELQQWKGGDGKFQPSAQSRIVWDGRFASLESVAQIFADDYAKMFGVRLPVVSGKASEGDFYFTQRKNRRLAHEGYKIRIGKKVEVEAPERIGVFWATRTLLQLSEQNAERALPQGQITDWPEYAVRGFMLDCGRKFFSIEQLRDYVKVMSYYKINTFQIHLNDNGFLEYFGHDWNKTYSAFRLECDTYPGLTAQDGFYTKKEFIELQQLAQRYGIDIVPEIDSPAHALAFTHYRPELASKEYGMDHFDISKQETYDFMDALFKEYLEGENPVFVGPHVNIGTDEYSNKDQQVVEQFRKYTDHYIRLMERYGKQPWLWGALTHAKGETPVKSDNVVLTLWNTGFADPMTMKQLGYKMISMNDADLYIVPAAGYYQDYLNIEKLYKGWIPSQIGKTEFKPGDDAILGGMFAIWNDHVGNGISTYDVYHRFYPAMQTLAVKMWTGSRTALPFHQFDKQRMLLSEAPGLNRLGRIGFTPTMRGKNSITLDKLQPGQTTPYLGVGYDYTVEFTIDTQTEDRGTVLFESPESTFYLCDPIREMVGFSRDGYLYTFNYRIQPNRKLRVKVVGDNKSTRLYIDGKLVDDLNQLNVKLEKAKPIAVVRTLFFPLQKAGNFKSQISDFKVY